MLVKKINNKPYGIGEYISRLKSYAFLISSLAKRELKIKYSRAFLGIGWLFINPIVSVVIYSLFFNYLLKMDTGNVAYIEFVFSGLVIWYIFTGIFSKGSTALLETRELIDKVAFPRMIILIAKMIPVIIESLVLFLVLIGLMIFYHHDMGLNLVISLFYLLHVIIFSMALAIFCSVIVVRFRDFTHLLPFIINFGIWLTPVFYPISIIPTEYQDYLRMGNPLALSIENFRNTLFMGHGIPVPSIIIFGFSLVFLFISFVFFIRFEKQIGERL